jgi:uncharacterized membrane protein YhaH (DUF805 family)
MNKTVARCIVICAVAVWIVLSLAVPWVLADTNPFLEGFVNHKLLSVLGVIVTITLASAANLHIELNKIEEAAGKSAFVNTRGSIKRSARWLIASLIVAVLVVLIKPLVAANPVVHQTAASLLNGAALLIILADILVLIDLTQAVARARSQSLPA